MQQNQDPYRVEAVDRALVLLGLLRDRGRLSVTEAAAELGVAPSTAHRLLSTLCHRGWAVQGERRRYEPGPELHGRTRAAHGIATIARQLRPYLVELFDRVGETVHLVVLTGPDVRFVDGIEGDQSLRVGLRIGARMPAYTTSGGKAMLAAVDAATLDALHPAGLSAWAGGSAHDLAELADVLREVRARGYAVNRDESEVGVTALGASVGAAAGQPLAALSLALPTVRFDAREADALADALRSISTRARTDLGWSATRG